MKYKLLVLGSDYSTIQVVKEAKRMGAYVIVADLMQTSPTKEEADESWLISTTDTEELIQRCRQHGVTGIMFGASDFNIENARKICKCLNLPIYCNSEKAWHIARDKRAFKDLCKKVGASVAEDYYLTGSLTDKELSDVTYPVVCKPSDKSGNRGMSYCANSQQLRNAYHVAREVSNAPIIVERQLRGQEINIHYVLADGEASLLYLNATHHQPGEAENLYSFKCTTSAYLKQYLKEMDASVRRVIREAGCRDGIVWFDCIRDEDGHFYLLEMGYRFGGVMTYVPYAQVTGFNVIKWMVEYALGIHHKAEELPKSLHTALPGCAGSYHLFAKQDGMIDHIEGLDKLAEMKNVYVDMPKRDGNFVRKFACSGLVGIYGHNMDELCNTLQKVNAVLKMCNSQGKNMFIAFTDYDGLRKEYQQGLLDFKK